MLARAAAPTAPGFWFAPAILTDVPRTAAVACEETFGPVAPILTARDADDAIALANATPFGLGASVWTRNAALADRCAAE